MTLKESNKPRRLVVMVMLCGAAGLTANLTYLLAHVEPVRSKSTVLLAHLDGMNLNQDQLFYSAQPGIFCWVSLTAVLTGVACALLPVMFNLLKRLISDYHIRSRTYVVAGIFLLLFFFLIGWLTYRKGNVPYVLDPLPILTESHWFTGPQWPLALFICPVLLASLSGLLGQLFINELIAKIRTSKEFNNIHGFLNSFLFVNAAMVVGAVLVTDSFKLALDGPDGSTHSLIPQSIIILYGLMYSFYVALFYLPVYSHLKYKGDELANAETDIALAGLFRLTPPTLETVKVFLSIVGPLLAALLPGLVVK